MNNSMNRGLVKAITLFAILIALSGMAVMASADTPLLPNKFVGNVTLNGEPAPINTTISAFIDGVLKGSITVESSGEYGDFDGLKYMAVTGNDSDGGKTITFTVCGATANQTAVWAANAGPQILDLTAVDDEAPAVTNATATPSAIVVDGVETTLNITIIDGCRCTVGTVTVNLSAIGGDEAQEMSRIGDTDVYSVTVTATEGTAPGAHCMYVNASDVFGNYNDSVCIDLVMTDVEAPVVSNPVSNPASIVANGTQESQLDVTVVDNSDIGSVTVDLSAIGGDEAQEMTRIDDSDVYSVTVTATEGTLADMYCLQVNASDVFGNYDNTSVCIGLEVTPSGLPQDGDMDGSGSVDFGDALYLARHVLTGGAMYPLPADGDVNRDGIVDFGDALYLARHVLTGGAMYPLYP